MVPVSCATCGANILPGARICSNCGGGESSRVWLIGSAPVCDIVVAGATVSRRHCQLSLSKGAYTVEDLHSANGTYVNGQRIDSAVAVEPHQPIMLGHSHSLPWDRVLEQVGKHAVQGSARPIRIGRNPDNDLVLDHPDVSEHHAQIHLEPEGARIEDLGSLNGTALNSAGNKIHLAPVTAADWIYFGSYRVAASRLLRPDLVMDKDSVRPSAKSTGTGDWKPEIACVFFMDIVGFTRLNPSEQLQARSELESFVQASEAFKSARREHSVIARPTGDGMALVFFTHPSTVAECAVQVARMLRKEPGLLVRVGLNQGTVYRIKDINGNDDVNGSGINMAQRVMDCGESGHILMSASVAEALEGTIDWHEYVRPIGERRIKHGDSIRIFSLCGPDFGRLEEPGQES